MPSGCCRVTARRTPTRRKRFSEHGMAQRNPPRLKTRLTLIASVIALLVLLASGALLILATVLHPMLLLPPSDPKQ